MGKKSRKSLIVGCTVLVLCVTVFMVWRLMGKQDITAMKQEIYALPTDTTAAELEKMGYLNLTEIQPKLPTKVASLRFEDCIVKAFADTEKGLAIRIFSSDQTTQTLTMCTNYFVREQHEENPGLKFRLDFKETESENGIVEVWLHPYKQDGTISGQENYLLLAYRSMR